MPIAVPVEEDRAESSNPKACQVWGKCPILEYSQHPELLHYQRHHHSNQESEDSNDGHSACQLDETVWLDVHDELNPKEFRDLMEIGYGNGGIVFKSLHLPSGKLVARKVFNSRIAPAYKRKMLEQELWTLRKCCSPFILHYYGAVVAEFQVSLVLEYMDLGSLSDIIQMIGPLGEPILGKICYNVLNGFTYLHEYHNIIHRDLKPSNILVNSKGQVKLCDFGDSVELINSRANSVVGTMGYMAPERIEGHDYDVTSDIWSLGVTLMELATGVFPFCSGMDLLTPVSGAGSPVTEETRRFRRASGGLDNMAIVELLEAITFDDPPKLDPTHFSQGFIELVQVCLIRDPAKRPNPMQLMSSPFVQMYKDLCLKEWALRIAALQQGRAL